MSTVYTPEQEAFMAAVAVNTPSGYHVVSGSNEESWFSWQPCELCGSHWGGDRNHAAFIQPGTDEDPLEIEVCIDCTMYVANGELPERWEP